MWLVATMLDGTALKASGKTPSIHQVPSTEEVLSQGWFPSPFTRGAWEAFAHHPFLTDHPTRMAKVGWKASLS